MPAAGTFAPQNNDALSQAILDYLHAQIPAVNGDIVNRAGKHGRQDFIAPGKTDRLPVTAPAQPRAVGPYRTPLGPLGMQLPNDAIRPADEAFLPLLGAPGLARMIGRALMPPVPEVQPVPDRFSISDLLSRPGLAEEAPAPMSMAPKPAEAPSIPGEPQIGDVVQWQSPEGILRMEKPARIRDIQSYGGKKYALVEGSNSGIPLDETVPVPETPAPQPAPARGNPRLTSAAQLRANKAYFKRTGDIPPDAKLPVAPDTGAPAPEQIRPEIANLLAMLPEGNTAPPALMASVPPPQGAPNAAYVQPAQRQPEADNSGSLLPMLGAGALGIAAALSPAGRSLARNMAREGGATQRIFVGAPFGAARDDALALREAGAPNADIFGKTGLVIGAEGFPRREISDAAARLTPAAQPGFSGMLADVLNHPELYKAAPQVAEAPITVTADIGKTGAPLVRSDPVTGEIALSLAPGRSEPVTRALKQAQYKVAQAGNFASAARHPRSNRAELAATQARYGQVLADLTASGAPVEQIEAVRNYLGFLDGVQDEIARYGATGIKADAPRIAAPAAPPKSKPSDVRHKGIEQDLYSLSGGGHESRLAAERALLNGSAPRFPFAPGQLTHERPFQNLIPLPQPNATPAELVQFAQQWARFGNRIAP